MSPVVILDYTGITNETLAGGAPFYFSGSFVCLNWNGHGRLEAGIVKARHIGWMIEN